MVPKSIPRVTGREVMAAVTAQLRRLEPQAKELHPRRAARGRGVPANLLTAPIGRGKQTHTCSSQRPPVIGGEDRRRDLMVRSSGTVPGVPGCSPRSTGFQKYNRLREPCLPYKRLDLPSHPSPCPCQGAKALPPFHLSHNPIKC